MRYKSAISALIAIIIINSSAYAYVETIKKYYADYIVYSSIAPVMATDGKSILRWQSSIKIKRGTNQSEIKAWAASETNVMRFNLTESAGNTMTEFITPATNWLEAQQDMFVNAYLIAVKINKADPTKLTEISYGQIDFVNTANVKLIDLSNGIIPTGEMVAYTPYLPNTPNQIAPENGAQYITTPTVALSWGAAARATSYKVKYWKNNDAPQYLTTTNTSISIPVSVGTTKIWYWWAVMAINDDGESAYSSSYYMITYKP